MAHPTITYWTQELVITADGYYKRQVTSTRDGVLQQADIPLFSSSARKMAGALPDPNWNLSRRDRKGYREEPPRWVCFAIPELVPTADDAFPVPTSRSNPLFEFYVDGTRYVVDALTVLQRMVATRDQLFTLLMSPFREMSVSAGKGDDDIVNIVLDTRALGRVGLLERSDLVGDTDASCLAYWLGDPDNVRALDECALTHLRKGEICLPKVSLRLRCLVRGVRVGNSVFVQSLAHELSSCHLHDVLWHGGWRSVRLVRVNGRLGVEISDRPSSHWHQELQLGNLEEHGCTRRRLSGDEVSQVREGSGWQVRL